MSDVQQEEMSPHPTSERAQWSERFSQASTLNSTQAGGPEAQVLGKKRYRYGTFLQLYSSPSDAVLDYAPSSRSPSSLRILLLSCQHFLFNSVQGLQPLFILVKQTRLIAIGYFLDELLLSPSAPN